MTTEGGREGGGGQGWVLGAGLAPLNFPRSSRGAAAAAGSGEERSRGCNLQALPGLTSFLSLCLLKLLPAASGFPEGSSRAEAGEGSGRGVEESCCSHPGPRLGLHGKVSAGGCPPVPLLARLGRPEPLSSPLSSLPSLCLQLPSLPTLLLQRPLCLHQLFLKPCSLPPCCC